MKYDYLIAGAGITGITLAERLASQLGRKVLVIDARDHIGGNCHDYTDENGILVQKYGPHIFHTGNRQVSDYLSQFTDWNNYKHKVMAIYKGKHYPIPINLDTVNMFYGLNLKDEREMHDFLEIKRVRLEKIRNSEDVVTSKFGKELYEAFVKHFTKRCWGKYPEELDKFVLERMPIRYDRNPYYFDDEFQGMPSNGFTGMFQKMLKHENISIKLRTDFFGLKDEIEYDKLIFTGRIDRFFDYTFGHLDYRTIRFVFNTLDQESHQPNSVVNHVERHVKHTRVTEFKKFYDFHSNKTVVCAEFHGEDGEPCYPVMTARNLFLLEQYKKKLKNWTTSFLPAD